jgi:hypothetical protein
MIRTATTTLLAFQAPRRPRTPPPWTTWAGPNSRILAMRNYPAGLGCRPTMSKAALPVDKQSGHAGAVTRLGVKRSAVALRRDPA